MKCTLFLFPALLTACATVHTRVDESEASNARAAFEQLKSLAGEWSGKAGSGENSFDANVSYRVTAGGSVVEERLFQGSEHEMVTMYHLDGDQLRLTHYCVAQNQPSMVAEQTSATPLRLSFRCDGGTNMSSENDAHMHEARIQLAAPDHLLAEWTLYKNGKPDHTAKFDLHRVSSKTTTLQFTSF